MTSALESKHPRGLAGTYSSVNISHEYLESTRRLHSLASAQSKGGCAGEAVGAHEGRRPAKGHHPALHRTGFQADHSGCLFCPRCTIAWTRRLWSVCDSSSNGCSFGTLFRYWDTESFRQECTLRQA